MISGGNATRSKRLGFKNPTDFLCKFTVPASSTSFCSCYGLFEDCEREYTAKVLIILSISFLLVAAEDALTTAITFSALIAIMFIGIGLQKKESGSGKKALGKIRKALGGS